MRARLAVIALCVICVLVGISGGLYGRWQHSEAATAREYASSLERSNKALRGRLVAIPTEVQRQKEARREAEQALEVHKEWADRPVPDPVRNGLCKRLRCR